MSVFANTLYDMNKSETGLGGKSFAIITDKYLNFNSRWVIISASWMLMFRRNAMIITSASNLKEELPAWIAGSGEPSSWPCSWMIWV